MVFHLSTGALEVFALIHGFSSGILFNVFLRIVISILFWYFGIYRVRKQNRWQKAISYLSEFIAGLCLIVRIYGHYMGWLHVKELPQQWILQRIQYSWKRTNNDRCKPQFGQPVVPHKRWNSYWCISNTANRGLRSVTSILKRPPDFWPTVLSLTSNPTSWETFPRVGEKENESFLTNHLDNRITFFIFTLGLGW